MSNFEILKEYEENLMMVEDIIGSGVTNNHQLDKLGMYLFDGDYLGTFSSNKFPGHILNEQCFIINNKSSRTNGEHWIAVYKRNGKVYGYDSFNRSIHNMSKFWNNKHIINANTNRDQSYTENSRGARSMAWLISFHKFGPKIIDII